MGLIHRKGMADDICLSPDLSGMKATALVGVPLSVNQLNLI